MSGSTETIFFSDLLKQCLYDRKTEAAKFILYYINYYNITIGQFNKKETMKILKIGEPSYLELLEELVEKKIIDVNLVDKDKLFSFFIVKKDECCIFHHWDYIECLSELLYKTDVFDIIANLSSLDEKTILKLIITFRLDMDENNKAILNHKHKSLIEKLKPLHKICAYQIIDDTIASWYRPIPYLGSKDYEVCNSVYYNFPTLWPLNLSMNIHEDARIKVDFEQFNKNTNS